MPGIQYENATVCREFEDDASFDENPRRQDQQGPKQHRSILRNKVVLSILVTETAERVAYFGFRAVLVLYFTNGLKFSESTSVSLFASVSGLAYLSPLLGALLADSAWGRYRTIWRFGSLYSIGMCLITLGAYHLGQPLPISCPISMNASTDDCGDVSDELNRSRDIVGENLLIARSLSFIGLIFVCIGTGGIKPCVSAFGADQVVLPDSRETRHVPETLSSTMYSDVSHQDSADLTLENDNANEKEAAIVNLEPPISTNVASQDTRDEHVREFFNSFYFCINVGALLSFALIPVVRAKFGFGAAFLLPTISMIGALGIFLSQRKAYKHRTRDSSQPSLSTTLYFCWTIVCGKTYQTYTQIDVSATQINSLDASTSDDIHPSCDIDDEDSETAIRAQDENIPENETNRQVRRDAEQVLHLMPLMLFFPIFWMLYDQQGSVWTLQATRLDRHGLEPEQMLFLNPLEIMLFIPLFDKIVYPWLEDKGFNIQPLKRMEYGMFLGAVAFITSALLEYSIEQAPPNSISLAWQIPQITILTVAEILLNVTGLEFAYSQAPDSLQALILALFLFTTAIGDGFGSILFATVFRDLNTSVTMVTCAVSMLINLAFFSRVARRWKPYQASDERNHDQLDRRENDEEDGLQLTVLAKNGVMS